MPTVTDFNFLPDMGRMIATLLLAEKTFHTFSDRGGERSAAIYTLIRSAKLNGLDPEAYLPTPSLASPSTPLIESKTVAMGRGRSASPRRRLNLRR
jgi:hypothetical protein